MRLTHHLFIGCCICTTTKTYFLSHSRPPPALAFLLTTHTTPSHLGNVVSGIKIAAAVDMAADSMQHAANRPHRDVCSSLAG